MANEFRDIRALPIEGLGRDYSGLKAAIIHSVDASCAGLKEAGVLFSGGVDSTLLAVLLSQRIKVKCYTAGFQGAQDLEWAPRVADQLGLSLEVVELDGLECMLPKIIKAIGDTNIMRVGVSVPVYACCGRCSQKAIFSGVGSEEIFAGYQRHCEAFKNGWNAMQESMWQGIGTMWKRDVERDTLVAKAFGISMMAPFTEDEVIKEAMSLHPETKYCGGALNKLVLRKIALELGVPKDVCERPKKAAQYGSLADREIRKLARKNGFREAQNYLNSTSLPL